MTPCPSMNGRQCVLALRVLLPKTRSLDGIEVCGCLYVNMYVYGMCMYVYVCVCMCVYVYPTMGTRTFKQSVRSL